jgi:hypothetical protein
MKEEAESSFISPLLDLQTFEKQNVMSVITAALL